MLLHVLLLAALAALSGANHDLDTNCGRLGRCCGENAQCSTTHPHKCVCNSGYYGCPLVECHPPGYFQCVMKQDPHLVGYAQPTANLNWPCKYRMTRIQHELTGGVPGLAFCAFEVFGYNEVENGKYYTSGMEISFSIVDVANQYFGSEDVLKWYFDITGVALSTNVNSPWGTGVHSTFGGVNVYCAFDSSQRFAIFTVPQCDFSVRFRPRNANETCPQSKVPAISIVTGQQTIFGQTELGRFGESLCGETALQGDTNQLYKDRATLLGLKSRHLALLFEALNQTNVQQESFVPGGTSYVLQDEQRCNESVSLFASCASDSQKSDAVALCARLLKKMAGCSGILALEAFNGCLEAACGDKTTGCSRVAVVAGSSGCKMPRKLKQFCS